MFSPTHQRQRCNLLPPLMSYLPSHLLPSLSRVERGIVLAKRRILPSPSLPNASSRPFLDHSHPTWLILTRPFALPSPPLRPCLCHCCLLSFSTTAPQAAVAINNDSNDTDIPSAPLIILNPCVSPTITPRRLCQQQQ